MGVKVQKIFSFFLQTGNKNIRLLVELTTVKFKATFEEARQTCCSMGANLVSFKSPYKENSLLKLAKEYPDLAGEYWTSGLDTGCNGNFRWCSVDRAFFKGVASWAKKEPNLERGNCVWTKLSYKKIAVLSTDDCSVKKKFICEVISKSFQ